MSTIPSRMPPSRGRVLYKQTFTLPKNFWTRVLGSCYSTLRRWLYAKSRPGLSV